MNSCRSARTFWICGLLLCAIVLRSGAAWYWRGDSRTDPDTYVALATGLVEGRGFSVPGTQQPTAYRPPGYPLILAGSMLCFPLPATRIVPLLNIVADMVLILGVVAWLLSRQASLTRAIAAGTILTFDPLLVRYIPLPMTETLCTALTACALLLFSTLQARDVKGGSYRLTGSEVGLWALTGALLGSVVLCRPAMWVMVAALVLIEAIRCGMVLSSGVAKRIWLTRLVCGLAFAGLALSWGSRNALVLGHPILTTTHGGYTLLLANNPVFTKEVARQPWGTVWGGASLNRWQNEMLQRMEAAVGPDANEVAKDRWQSQQAWNWIQQHPADFLAGMWYRVRSFWSVSSRGAALAGPNKDRRGSGAGTLPVAISLLVSGWYLTLFGLAIVGLVKGWRTEGNAWWPWLLLVVCLQGVHLFYWTDTRMRMPIEPALALFASRCWGPVRPSR